MGLCISIHYSNKQANLDTAVATFQVRVQTTADYQNSQQLAVQQTQIAMQSQMDAWTRQQSSPFVKVIVPPEHIFIVEKITSERSASGSRIDGQGLLNMILANNGGGKAGLINIDWGPETNGRANLKVGKIEFNDMPGNLPNTIDAQTPIKIQLDLEAIVPYEGDLTGKSDYQLGQYWKTILQSTPNRLTITFSNTDPINIEITDIQLAMPIMSFQPNPPSPFSVTNQTSLSIACFSTQYKQLPVDVMKSYTR